MQALWIGALLCAVHLTRCTEYSDLKDIFQGASTQIWETPRNTTCATKTCPAEQTCCNDDWDCCPEPEAVCCKDKNHCCPKGYICDDQPFICRWPDDNHRVKADNLLAQANLKDVTCDGEHVCPSGDTCCKLPGGTWGCCPMPSAVCCNDHIHCCPSDHICDLSSGKCTSKDGMSSVPLLAKAEARNIANVICPDHQSECPSGTTCCKLSSGQWGCCPLPQAVCCSDMVHCCPNGYTCNTGAGTCSRGLESLLWVKKFAASKVGNVVCPGGGAQCPSGMTREVSAAVRNVQCDGSHYCPDGNTCCKLSSGQWGCCPLPQAVCCSDMVHCCPNGYTCNTGAGTCSRGLESLPWVEKFAASEVGDVVCPGGKAQCPSGTTCCKLSSGQWGCCPVPNAVCCSDGQHCCPSGYTCNAGTCSRGFESLPWVKKFAASKVGNVVCPGGGAQCPSGMTREVSAAVRNVQCDGSHYCPDGNTCCKLSSGQWGCCPLPNAVCCSDGQHCCPSGYTCNAGACSRGVESLPWVKKFAASKVGNVVCPGGGAQCPSGMTREVSAAVRNVQCDGSHYCPDGNTCCKLSSGQWGCCPLPNAVCCSDGQHCCPSGYTCNAGTCSRGVESLPWVKKFAASKVGNVVCPGGGAQCPSGMTREVSAAVRNVQCDGSHYCPDGNTCCKLSSGQWGCCPLPQAVCCSDMVHCCPNGYTCNTGAGTCSRGLESLPWVEKFAASEVGDVVCPGGEAQCPSGNTCCKLSSGQWGCCPLPNAVCCSDGQHCCPSGYTCNAGACSRGVESLPWVKKFAASKVGNVVCPGGKLQCPSGNTCCKLSSGQWGCCPVPNAVCCSDGQNCCPSGWTCDAGGCSKGVESLPWVKKFAASKVGNVVCPGGKLQCPSGNTCCKLSSGQWGCCPVPNAVCCSDGQNCCPSGWTCDAGGCSKGVESLPWVKKFAASEVGNVVCPGGGAQCPLTVTREVSAAVHNVQCDKSHYCPDGNTCCELSSGQWGCCPLAAAVCCSDHEHCCPSGYTCATSTGKCLRGYDIISWMNKAPTKQIPISSVVTYKPTNLNSVMCDESHECPDNYTCCRMLSGQWGCCPFNNATCCPDGVHCCESGYQCDNGQCIRSNSSLDFFKIAVIN